MAEKEEIKKDNEKILNNKEEMVSLKIKIAFIDKYNETYYKKGSIIEFKKTRADELLKDKRKLVEIAK